MPIRFQCPSCGTRIKAPDAAAGKRTRCPKCETRVQIPDVADDVVFDAEPAFEIAEQAPADDGRSAGREKSGKPRKPCPACGEMIIAGAAKCRFCGEIFDPSLKKKKKKRKSRSFRYEDDGDDMSASDWVVAILCSGIGCIAGIVWLIQGKSKGLKMIGVSLAAGIAKDIVFYVIKNMDP